MHVRIAGARTILGAIGGFVVLCFVIVVINAREPSQDKQSTAITLPPDSNGFNDTAILENSLQRVVVGYGFNCPRISAAIPSEIEDENGKRFYVSCSTPDGKSLFYRLSVGSMTQVTLIY